MCLLKVHLNLELRVHKFKTRKKKSHWQFINENYSAFSTFQLTGITQVPDCDKSPSGS